MKGVKKMKNYYYPYRCPFFFNSPMYNPNMHHGYKNYPHPYWPDSPMHMPDYWKHLLKLKDYGPDPFVINIDKATKQNDNFRLALWTGEHLQLTLMSIDVGEDIGLEMHPEVDQFIRIEEGQGIVKMGDTPDNLDFQAKVCDDFIIIIPAGKWHNLINTGNIPIKLYSIYAPPEHPHGTIHETKEDAEADEENHHC